MSERRGDLSCFNTERREKHESEDHRTAHGSRRCEEEKPDRHHRRREQSGEDSPEMYRVGVAGMSPTRPQREVQMDMQVDMPVLLLLA